jgi:sugar lactone lactonase YvrE
MTRTISADLVDDAGARLGEGPAYDAARDRLVWVDILGKRVHVCDRSGRRVATHDVGRHVGAALPAADGTILLAVREGFATLDAGGGVRPLLDVLGDRPELRFNDGKCDPAGRAFAGTMAYEETPGAASLYRLDPGPAATPVLDGLTISNGLGWSPDGTVMYVTDTPRRAVDAFDYDPATGSLSGRRPAVRPEGAGFPDGMCTDDDGALWVALWGGHAVRRYTPAGRLDAEVRLPVPYVTSCCFVGDTLFVTTAQGHGGEPVPPHAGGLFAVRPGFTGPPATPWAGLSTP